MSPKRQGLDRFQHFLGEEHKGRPIVQQKIQTDGGKDQTRQNPEHPIVQTRFHPFFVPASAPCIKIARRGMKSTKTISYGFAIAHSARI